MGEIRENVSRNLGYFLNKRGISQKELAVKMGVSQAAVTNWVKGKNLPDIEAVAEICEILEVSVTALFGLEDDENKEFELVRASFQRLSKPFKECMVKQINDLVELQEKTK